MIAEYQNYTPEHPALIPSSHKDAQTRLRALLETSDPASASDEDFLNGWWALFWLHPGLHPDDFEVWPDEYQTCVPWAAEAFRRFSVGQITDSQCYPAEASHRRIWIESSRCSENQTGPSPHRT